MLQQNKFRVYEGLAFAALLTFISGYLNAFTFITQGGRLAGIQSGNVLLLAYHMALGNAEQIVNFLLPIAFFMLGQCLTYSSRKWFETKPYSWHFSSSLMMTILLACDVVLTPFFSSNVTIAILALISSIQVETFRRLKGNAYANVMMTGNVKNAAYLLYMGLVEKDKELQNKGISILLIILSFMIGVICSTKLSHAFGEYALAFALIPMVIVTLQLGYEKKN